MDATTSSHLSLSRENPFLNCPLISSPKCGGRRLLSWQGGLASGLCFTLAVCLCRYVSVDGEECMEVCGGKELGERYLLRLIQCMDKLFLEKNKVVPSLVSDVDQYVYKGAGQCSTPHHMVR